MRPAALTTAPAALTTAPATLTTAAAALTTAAAALTIAPATLTTAAATLKTAAATTLTTAAAATLKTAAATTLTTAAAATLKTAAAATLTTAAAALTLSLLLAACGASPPATATAGGPGAGVSTSGRPALVAGFADAIGGAAWDHAQVIESRATIEVGGLRGTLDSTEDVVQGRSRSLTRLGAIDQAEGFDGVHPWDRSPGGEVGTYDAADAVARARTGAWLTRRGFRRADGARYRDLGLRRDHDRRLRGAEAVPDGGAPVELWFDDAGMLAETRQHVGRKTVTTALSDWRTVDGMRLPFHAVIDEGDPRNLVTVVTTEAHLRAALDDAAFAPPTTDAARLTFAGGASTSELPFELINNHIYVNATVDGQPVRMLLDTGGANLLTPAAATRLGLAAEGTMAASGAGAEQVDLAFARGKRLVVGGVTLADPVFYVIDLGALADVEGVDLDGLVGYEMFARLAVRIDYPGRHLTLTTPKAFTAPAGAIAVPFEMSDRIPIVRGSIDGLAGRFWVDTGSRVSLTTMAKFTRDHDLEGTYHPRFEAVTGWGVGGAARAKPVRFHQVTIGGATVHDVVGDLFTGDKGALADPDAAGNLGGGILHRFVVTFDYAGRTMYLEPGPDADAGDRFDRSGLFLLRDDGGRALRVGAVTPTGPAEAAGVRDGDRITTIDGAAVSTRPVFEWRALLRDRAPGTPVTLGVVRDGRPREITIKLAELVP